MSRLVTSSPHSGSTTVSPAATRSFSIFPKSRNSSSYLTVPRPLTIATTRLPASCGLSASSLADQEFGQFGGGGHGVIGNARFAVDAQAEGHVPRRDSEQRRVRAGQRAAVEGHTQRAGAVVRPDGEPFDVVQVQSRFGGGSGDLEHCQVAGDAAPLLDLVQRGAGDVVGDQDCAGFNAFGVEAQLGLAEVQDVTGIVAVAQQHAAAGVGRLGHAVDLAGRGRGEHVAAGRGGGQSRSHEAGEGGVVPGAAADHQGNLPGRDLGGADDAAVDTGNVPAVGRNKAVQCLIREISGIVEDLGHGSSLNPCWRTNAVDRRSAGSDGAAAPK